MFTKENDMFQLRNSLKFTKHVIFFMKNIIVHEEYLPVFLIFLMFSLVNMWFPFVKMSQFQQMQLFKSLKPKKKKKIFVPQCYGKSSCYIDPPPIYIYIYKHILFSYIFQIIGSGFGFFNGYRV